MLPCWRNIYGNNKKLSCRKETVRHKALDKRQSVRVMSVAFDYVDHNVVLQSLESIMYCALDDVNANNVSN